MKIRFTIIISSIIALTAACLIAYYLLLSDNCFHSSISSIIDYSQTLDIEKHIAVLGFLPIYIALMVFGAALVGIYLSSSLQKFMRRLIQKPFNSTEN